MFFHVVRTFVAVLGGLFLLPGLPLLALGAFGVYLMITPEPPLPPGVHHNLGQGFGGLLLVMYCGIPGTVLSAIGLFLVDRARKAFDSVAGSS